MRLTVDDERVDAAPDIVNRRIPGQAYIAGFRIDLDLANRASVRKYRLVHLVVGDDRKTRGEVVRQSVACHFLRELKKVEAAIAFPCNETSVAEIDAIRSRVQDCRGGTLALGN